MYDEIEILDDDGNDDEEPQHRYQDELSDVEEQLTRIEQKIQSLLLAQSKLHARKDQLARLVQQEQTAPRKDWDSSFPWDAEVDKLIEQAFHLPGFRPLQREIINATCQGRDVLALLPSGGGKSLTYQLPAFLGSSPSLTVVISPLLSLIQDQEEANDILKHLDSPTNTLK
eukprot:gene15233-21315_t